VRYANGVSGKVGHNLNALYYQQTVYEVTEEFYPGQAVVWGRSGYAGSQRFPLQWGGDTGVTWEYMQKSLRGALTYALSGAAFMSFDVGGFAGTPTPEVYLRWSAMGFFFSHIRAHGTSPREPEAFGPEAVEIFRKLAEDRLQLMPYLLESAQRSIQDGLPLVRPLVLMHPDDPNTHAIDFEYYLGPDLLVAPTLSDRHLQRIYLPPGDWVNLYHPDQSWTGGRWLTLPAPPLDEIWCWRRRDIPPAMSSCPLQLRG
ncbi:MAG: alpha-xylosidase, partial [Sulfobacillus sp.]|nr:alpha-xylosidase [Sulfobacillus sp.]